MSSEVSSDDTDFGDELDDNDPNTINDATVTANANIPNLTTNFTDITVEPFSQDSGPSLPENVDVSVALDYSNLSLSIYLAVIYRPPQRSMLQFAMDMLEYMEMNVNTTGNIILTGDFNIKMNNPDDPDMNTLSNLLDSFDLVNHVRFPTHRSMNTLDLVITRGDTNFVRNPSQGRLF